MIYCVLLLIITVGVDPSLLQKENFFSDLVQVCKHDDTVLVVSSDQLNVAEVASFFM